MKTTLFLLGVIVLVLAGFLALAGSAEAGDNTFVWTNADGGNSNWSDADNWDGPVGETPGADGTDTIDRTTSVDPTIDVDQTGWTLHFNFTGVLAGSLSDFIGGTGADATVENVTLNAEGLIVKLDEDVTGTLIVSDGQAETDAATVAVTGAVTVAAGATLGLGNGHTMTCPSVSLGGQLFFTGGTLNVAGFVTCTGDSASVRFFSNDGEIQGGFDAAGYAVACEVNTGLGATGTLTLDQAGEFDLGTEPSGWADVSVVVAAGADATLQRDAAVKGIDFQGGAFDFGDAGRTITVHDGGFDNDNSTDIGTAGCITVASGATTAVASWHDAADPLALLTIDGDVTFSTPLRVETKRFAGSGAVDVNSKRLRLIYPAADFWTYTGTMTDGGAGGLVEIYLSASRSNAAAIDTGDVDVSLSGTNVYTLTAAAGFACAELTISSPAGAGKYFKLDVTGGAFETTGDVLFGLAAADARSAKLTLCDGETHTIGGDLKENTGCTGNVHELDLGGTVRFAGDMTLNDIDVDFNSAVLIATGTGKEISGSGATALAATDTVIVDDGNAAALTVTSLDTTDNVVTVNCTDGGSNGAGVQFRRTGFGGFGF